MGSRDRFFKNELENRLWRPVDEFDRALLLKRGSTRLIQVQTAILRETTYGN
jgi:hypothetical protein